MSTNDKTHWRVVTPTTWPAPPAEMSVSTHAEIDECPRRWALSAADYPDLWSGRGYPQKLQVAALAGSVVHLALEVFHFRRLLEKRERQLEAGEDGAQIVADAVQHGRALFHVALDAPLHLEKGMAGLTHLARAARAEFDLASFS